MPSLKRTRDRTPGDGRILVPFSPEAELSGVNRTLHPGQTLWYHRTLAVPAITAGMRLLLHIGACDQRAKIFCNGQYVFEHVGGYTAFSADLTAFLRPGDNELIVQARDDLETSQLSRGKQSSHRGGIWYTPQSGIWQTVWCEWVPDNHVKAIRYTPDLITNQLLYQVQAKHPAGAIVRLSLHGEAVDGKHRRMKKASARWTFRRKCSVSGRRNRPRSTM